MYVCIDGIGSGSIAFFNKALISVYGFNYSYVLLLFQLVLCVLLFHILLCFNLFTFTHPLPKLGTSSYKYGRYTHIIKLIPLSCFSMLNSSSGMSSLQNLSLPMYSVLKRMTPLFVAIIQYILYKKKQSHMVIISLVLVACGIVIAQAGDLVFDA